MLAAPSPLRALAQGLHERGRVGWRVLQLGALVVALALTPSTWRAPWRTPLAAQLVRAALPLLPWFTLLAAIVSLVLTRIVLVTAQSYGLSQYALEMVVRVLVLELIPLAAALFAALRCTIPLAAEIATLRSGGGWDALAAQGYPVRIYVPYGDRWYPYFMRHLAERPANLWFFLSNFFKK